MFGEALGWRNPDYESAFGLSAENGIVRKSGCDSCDQRVAALAYF
jgi:hypothetical protein